MTTENEVLANLLDPKYFIESCLFIVDKNSQKVPFIWKPCFTDWWNNHSTDDFIIKSRKMGFSAGISAIWLHACAFKENTRAVIVSHEEKATQRLMERVRYYIETSLVPIKVKKNSEHEISFPETNSTYWIGTAGQRAFGRGDDITHLHLSECCFYPDISVITGVKEAMRNDGIVVRESTANGAGTPTHKMFMRSIEKKSSIKPHFFGWFKDSDYCSKDFTPFELNPEEKELKQMFNLSWGQLHWRRDKIAAMDEPEKFVQEYPASFEEAFITSGQMVFKWQDIKRQEMSQANLKWLGNIENNGGQISINPDKRGNLNVWRTPRSAI
jgi:hypothetical protein